MLKVSLELTAGRIKRNARMLEQGFISTREAMDGFVFDMVEFGPLSASGGLSEELPDAVKAELAEFMLQQRERGYDWRPFLIGPGPGHPRKSYQKELRELDETVSPHLADYFADAVASSADTEPHA